MKDVAEGRQLLCTYIVTRNRVVTTGRNDSFSLDRSEAVIYETIVWEWDNKTKTSGRIMEGPSYSGRCAELAMKSHYRLVDEILRDDLRADF